MNSNQVFLIIVAVACVLFFILFVANTAQWNRLRTLSNSNMKDRSNATLYFWLNLIWAFVALGVLAASIYFLVIKYSNVRPKILAMTRGLLTTANNKNSVCGRITKPPIVVETIAEVCPVQRIPIVEDVCPVRLAPIIEEVRPVRFAPIIEDVCPLRTPVSVFEDVCPSRRRVDVTPLYELAGPNVVYSRF